MWHFKQRRINGWCGETVSCVHIMSHGQPILKLLLVIKKYMKNKVCIFVKRKETKWDWSSEPCLFSSQRWFIYLHIISIGWIRSSVSSQSCSILWWSMLSGLAVECLPWGCRINPQLGQDGVHCLPAWHLESTVGLGESDHQMNPMCDTWWGSDERNLMSDIWIPQLPSNPSLFINVSFMTSINSFLVHQTAGY